jgi:hypothetical protein
MFPSASSLILHGNRSEWSEWAERHGRKSREGSGRAQRELPRYKAECAGLIAVPDSALGFSSAKREWQRNPCSDRLTVFSRRRKVPFVDCKRRFLRKIICRGRHQPNIVSRTIWFYVEIKRSITPMAIASGRVIRREASQESRRRIIDARGTDYLHELCYLPFRHRIAFQGNLSCAAAQQQPDEKTNRFGHVADESLVAH